MINLYNHYPHIAYPQDDVACFRYPATDFIDQIDDNFYHMHKRDSLLHKQLWEFFYSIEKILK